MTPLIDDTSPFHGTGSTPANILLPPGHQDSTQDSQNKGDREGEEAGASGQGAESDCESDREEEGLAKMAMDAASESINKNILKDMRRFRRKQKGYIDVWWLFDDGGLYEQILSQPSADESCVY